MRKFILVTTLTLTLAGVSLSQMKSVYTSIGEKACRTLKTFPDDGGSYVGECPGVEGYKLELIEGDLRQSINVIAPGGRKTELNMWNVSGGFSSVGSKVEWRMNGKKPRALIVRFNASEDPDAPSKITSYLIVAKLDGDTVCITAAVAPRKSQNSLARHAADGSGERPCRFQK